MYYYSQNVALNIYWVFTLVNFESFYLGIVFKSPDGNTPQGTNYTATCLPSRKLSMLDEPDIQDTAG